MRFIARFADQVNARIDSVNISYTYSGLIEGYYSGGTRHFLKRLKKRMEQIKSGEILGVYCFEPELVDEEEYYHVKPPFLLRGKCFKDNQVSASLTISEKDAQYSITLEWYYSTRELAERPLVEIVQEYVGLLRYSDIQMYCKKTDWEDLC